MRRTYKVLSIASIIKLNNEGIDKFVYLLSKNNEIVYVGQSNGYLLSRISTHLKDKDFDKVYYIAVKPKDDLNALERTIISKYNPKLNTVNKNHSSIHMTAIKGLLKRNLRTSAKIKKIREIDPEISTRAIADLLNVTPRCIRYHAGKSKRSKV